jgi:heparin/heparan-sulfate lyase
LVNTILLPESDNARITTVGGPGKEFWVFGTNYPNATEPIDSEAGGWRVELSPATPSASDLFLNVIQITDRAKDGYSKLEHVEKVESGQMVGVRLADRLVLFSSGGDRVTQPVLFTVRAGMVGPNTIRFLIADLAPGMWQVSRNDRIEHANLNVTADAGTLYFEGPPGSYLLRR